MVTVDEQALVRRAQAGSAEAFEQLVLRHERRLLNLAVRLMGNPADAADALQEALVKVYLRLPGFRGDAAFATWLFRIVTTACLDLRKQESRHRHRSLDQPGSVTGAVLAYQGEARWSDPVEWATQQETVRRLYRAIEGLRDEHRELLVLQYLCGLSYQEMTERTGLAPTTIKSRLHRARLALRKAL